MTKTCFVKESKYTIIKAQGLSYHWLMMTQTIMFPYTTTPYITPDP